MDPFDVAAQLPARRGAPAANARLMRVKNLTLDSARGWVTVLLSWSASLRLGHVSAPLRGEGIRPSEELSIAKSVREGPLASRAVPHGSKDSISHVCVCMGGGLEFWLTRHPNRDTRHPNRDGRCRFQSDRRRGTARPGNRLWLSYRPGATPSSAIRLSRSSWSWAPPRRQAWWLASALFFLL
jgi:hypothetical protein